MSKHIKIPITYSNTSGIANATMLVTSAGVNNIDKTKITNTAISKECPRGG